MQIHDLNTKALTDPAYVAFDDGTDTYKADFKAEIDNAAADAVADADLTDNTVAFTSGDATSPTAWTAVSVLTSGLTIKVLFNRISTMIKNVRWLYSKLGTTDISSIGGGTVTGAISSLNSKTVSYLLSATVENQSFTAGECRAVQFTFTVPEGFRIVTINDYSNYAYLLGSPIQCGTGDGQVTAYLNYYATVAMTNRKLVARAFAVKV